MSFERKLTVGFLFALVIQIAGSLVWAGAAAERLSTIEQIQQIRTPAFERLARVEAKLESIESQLDRIERKLEAVQDD